MTNKDKGVTGVRHRVTYRKDNLYVNIFPGKCELFISTADQDQDALTGAGLDALSRLLSLVWKNSTLDKVVGQLRKASRSDKDIPRILANLLEEDDFDLCDDQTGD